MKQRILAPLAALVLPVLAYVVLLEWSARRDVAGVLLSPNSHTPSWAIATMMLLVLLRVFTLVVLPPLAIAMLAARSMRLLGRWRAYSKILPTPAPTPRPARPR